MYDFVPGAFFKVYFNGAAVGMAGEFTSVSGLGMEIEYDTYSEGGSNYPRRFFKRAVPQTLVLEQGTVTTVDAFSTWMMEVNLGITRELDGEIMLTDNTGEVKRTWTIVGATLTKYVGPNLNSMQSELAVNRIEFQYNGCY